jgi:hypothetical protein
MNFRNISIKDSMKLMRILWNENEFDPLKLRFDTPKDADELKKIYIVLAKMFHPDNKDSGFGSKRNFQEL